jgi:ubiquinone/menaquinone biosynthesis C-methylase UbiE
MLIKIFEDFNSVKNVWNDFINKINNGIIPKDPPDTKIIDKLANLKPSGNVLDISIGDGSNSEYFIKKGYNVYGTDISDLAISTMKKKYPKYNWKEHDTEQKFPYEDNKFDIVFARLSLHYFSKESIVNILNDIYRILKVNGILYIMVKINNIGNIDTVKKSYIKNDWLDMVKNNYIIIDNKVKNKKVYSFEKSESQILEIIAEKKIILFNNW